MHILMISNSVGILSLQSGVARRMAEYGTLVRRLSIMVMGGVGKPVALSASTTAYPLGRQKLWAPLAARRRISAVIRDGGAVDLVTAQDPFLAGLVGYCIARSLGVPLQLQVHTDFMNPHFRAMSAGIRLRYWLARMVLPKADCIRAASPRIARSLGGIAQKNGRMTTIDILPIYVPLRDGGSAPEEGGLRRRYPGREKIVLMVSRLVREKDIPLAIRAVKAVVRRHPTMLLVIVGEGPEERKLRRIASAEGVGGNVAFEGWASQETLRAYYQTADCYLLTSRYEGYGRTLVEAAAMGASIVTTDVGVAREIAGAVVVPVGDDTAIAAALEQTFLQPQITKLPDWVITEKAEHLRQYRASWERCGRILS